MVEIPEHLLKRSKDARSKATGSEPSGESKVEAADSQATDSTSSADTSGTKTSQKVEETPTLEKTSPYVNAANNRKKIPWWAASALVFLPVWAIVYVGTLERPTVEVTGVLQQGSEIFADRCSACHGANGGGGAGYKLADGEVLITFPQIENMIEWIAKGSDGFGIGNPYGDPGRGRIVAGGMPGFGDVLTAEELISVVLHERTRYGNSEVDALLAEEIDHLIEAGDMDLDMYFDAETVTPDLIAEIIGETH